MKTSSIDELNLTQISIACKSPHPNQHGEKLSSNSSNSRSCKATIANKLQKRLY